MQNENDTLTQKNTGFVEVAPIFGRDFVAGAETAILVTPVLPSGDWREFLPTNATQLMKGSNGIAVGDTNACVSFAGVQSVETQLNFQIKTGRITDDNFAWLKTNGYIDGNGSVYLSKRFTAKMSGTTPAVGNSLPAVWGSLKNDGCVPDAMWPMPTPEFDALIKGGSYTTQDFWNIYYAPVPFGAKTLGQQFAIRFPVLYEWLVYPGTPAAGAKLLADLVVSPLEIATAVCPGWNTDAPINACGPGTAHATLLTFVESNHYDILDHYVPFQKEFSPAYDITYGMRGVVGGTKLLPPQTFQYTFTKQLTYNKPALNDAIELRALQNALQTLKSPRTGQTYMTPGVYGPFGPQTKVALTNFEIDNGIVDPQPGENFGPQNRTKMNALLIANK